MPTTAALFEIECGDDAIIVTPTKDLGEFDYQQLVAESQEAFDLLDRRTDRKNVVLDLRNTNYFGSTALGMFVKLWKRVGFRGGRMAFCNVSEFEREVLAATRLDTLWSICESKSEAVEAVRQSNTCRD
jgi:anti-anti-sigma factor